MPDRTDTIVSTETNGSDVTADERGRELRANLAEGKALKPGEVAHLFETTRQTIDRWLRNGVVVDGVRHYLTYRQGPARHRLIEAEGLRPLLAAHDRVRSAGIDTDGKNDSDDTTDR